MRAERRRDGFFLKIRDDFAGRHFLGQHFGSPHD